MFPDWDPLVDERVNDADDNESLVPLDLSEVGEGYGEDPMPTDGPDHKYVNEDV